MRACHVVLAAGLAMAPMAASALTVIGEATGPFDLGACGDTAYIGSVLASGGAGGHDVTFTACSLPTEALAEASITGLVAGTFSSLTASWANGGFLNVTDAAGNLLVPNVFAWTTVFTDGSNPQDLSFTWADSVDGVRFDYNVEVKDVAPIPVPAAALLLTTALAGLGLARRRG